MFPNSSVAFTKHTGLFPVPRAAEPLFPPEGICFLCQRYSLLALFSADSDEIPPLYRSLLWLLYLSRYLATRYSPSQHPLHFLNSNYYVLSILIMFLLSTSPLKYKLHQKWLIMGSEWIFVESISLSHITQFSFPVSLYSFLLLLNRGYIF